MVRPGTLRVRDIRTPRTVMFAVPAGTTVRELMPRGRKDTSSRPDDTQQKSTMVFSRIPVYRDGPDLILKHISQPT